MKSIFNWCQDITTWREEMGFKTPVTLDHLPYRDAMLGKLMLVVSEISEASEAVRNMDYDNFREEMADTAIRIFDICGAMNIDLEWEINKKMKINKSRERLHAKHTTL